MDFLITEEKSNRTWRHWIYGRREESKMRVSSLENRKDSGVVMVTDQEGGEKWFGRNKWLSFGD